MILASAAFMATSMAMVRDEVYFSRMKTLHLLMHRKRYTEVRDMLNKTFYPTGEELRYFTPCLEDAPLDVHIDIVNTIFTDTGSDSLLHLFFHVCESEVGVLRGFLKLSRARGYIRNNFDPGFLDLHLNNISDEKKSLLLNAGFAQKNDKPWSEQD